MEWIATGYLTVDCLRLQVESLHKWVEKHASLMKEEGPTSEVTLYNQTYAATLREAEALASPEMGTEYVAVLTDELGRRRGQQVSCYEEGIARAAEVDAFTKLIQSVRDSI